MAFLINEIQVGDCCEGGSVHAEPAFAADQTAYAPPAHYDVVKLSTDGPDRSVNSLTLDDGRVVTIVNANATGSGYLKFPHEHTTGTAAGDRIKLPPGEGTLSLAPGDSATFFKDPTATTGRVQLIHTTAAVRRPPWRPALAGGAHNDYAAPAGGFTFLAPALAGDATLTGLAGLAAGDRFAIYNPPGTAFSLTLAHASAGSLAANRFDLSSGADLVLSPGEGATLVYDGNGISDTGVSRADSTGGGGTLLFSADASDVAQIDVTGLTGHKVYKIYGFNFTTKSGAAVSLFARTSTDGGATFDSGGADYFAGGGPAAASLNLGTSVLPPDASANNGCHFELTVYDPGGGAYKMLSWSVSAWTGSAVAENRSAGVRQSTADVDAVRLFGSAGNLNGGVRAYGFS